MIAAVLQARVSSKRLPGKVIKPILGRPMISFQIERVKRSKRIEKLILATSEEGADDPIVGLGQLENIEVYRGSLNDVLDRFYKSVKEFSPAYVVRLTGDCPLVEPELIDSIIAHCIDGDFDYCTNALQPTFPDGLDVEVFRFSCLYEAWKEARLPSEREHVTLFMHSRPDRYKIGHYKQSDDMSKYRWTVDEPEDFELVKKIYEKLYPRDICFGMSDVIKLLEQNPELKTWNIRFERNEGMKKSIEADKEILAKRYKKSEELLERARRTIPLGSQTFSKSYTQFPYGVSPYFISKGKGSKVWDVDGNEYIDFVNSLAAVTLGYCDPDVDAKVKAQIENGTIFSLPSTLEMEVAEKLCEMVPCAQMVRFGKNGSDATSGAVRLARAYTGRDRVAVCGYHGWQDWYIGSTARHQGVPKSVRDLTHSFSYNNIESLDALFRKFPGEFAAVILEPMTMIFPEIGFLQALKDLTHKNGAILIFDETVTGFRFSNGGAQQYFDVTPDLATFGKGLANGYPVSAVAGRADIMRLMEEIFFSFTFGGECLSLAAASATLDKMNREPVTQTMFVRGQRIIDETNALISKYGAHEFIGIGGLPVWSFLIFKDVEPYSSLEIKTLFMQEAFARGILIIGTHNMSYAHTDADIDRLMLAYHEILGLISKALREGSLREKLRCEPIVPLFRVR